MGESAQGNNSKWELARVIVIVMVCSFGPIAALIWGMQSGNAYSYFLFLRLVVFLGAFVFFALFSGLKREAFRAVFVGIMVLFNPVLPIYLARDTWLKIDLVTVGAFVVGFGFWLVGFIRDWNSKTLDDSATVLPK